LQRGLFIAGENDEITSIITLTDVVKACRMRRVNMSRISMFIRHKSTHINKLNFIEKSKARKSKQLHSKLSKLERVSLQSSRVVGWYWYL